MYTVKEEKHHSHADQCTIFLRTDRSEGVQSNKNIKNGKTSLKLKIKISM